MSRAFLRHGLRFDVPVSKGKVGQYKEYPFIAVASWIQTLDKAGKLDRFLGMGPEVRRLADAGPSLLEFWKRYKRLYPNHEVFKLVAENALKLEECVPCYMHGDEGTTYKKDGCLCLSFHCAMGRGTISNKMGPITHEVLDDPHLNFVGHAFETRFLLSAMLRVVWLKLSSDSLFCLRRLGGKLCLGILVHRSKCSS